MNFSTGLIVDILIAVLIAAMVVHYTRRGFLAGVIDFFGNLISIGAAIWSANALSATLFEKLFRANLIARTTTSLSQSQGIVSLNEILSKISSFLPQNIIDTFLNGKGDGGTFDLSAPGIAQKIVEEVIRPLILPVISVLVFFLVYILCRVLFKFIAAAFKGMNHAPLLGSANKVLGGVMGLLVGVLYGYIVVCAVWVLVIITGGDLSAFSEAAVSQSIFYNLFMKIIPFT